MNDFEICSPTKDALDEDLLKNSTRSGTNAFLRAATAKKVTTLSTGAADPAFATATGSRGQAGYSISKAALNRAMANPGLVDTVTEHVTSLGTPQQSEDKAFVQALTKIAPNFSASLTPQASVKMML
ncbi:hypothetical protein B0H19DRAFT_1376408 [Mycena capillaripes]|nr:hypothetical protein B0H19DRAFT_1376408 [Mycena capillaripes]